MNRYIGEPDDTKLINEESEEEYLTVDDDDDDDIGSKNEANNAMTRLYTSNKHQFANFSGRRFIFPPVGKIWQRRERRWVRLNCFQRLEKENFSLQIQHISL